MSNVQPLHKKNCSRKNCPGSLWRGDRFPNFFLSDQRDIIISLYDKVKGKPIYVLLCPDLDKKKNIDQLEKLKKAFPNEQDNPVHIFIVTNTKTGKFLQKDFPWPLLSDHENNLLKHLSLDWQSMTKPVLYLLDPNQRILHHELVEKPFLAIFKQTLNHTSPWPKAEYMNGTAPVLIIPNVLSQGFCKKLIDTFETKGNFESGVHTVQEGQLIQQKSHDTKIRRDHLVQDPALLDDLKRRVAHRVIPEIKKAFQYPVTRFEEFKIVRYDSEIGGYFRPHRDNSTPQNFHRRFAMTLNLNADDYDGGALRFPEYGPHFYRPTTGSAVIFSCSLMHEALDVSNGLRYVLLSFLYGEDGVKQKELIKQKMSQAR